MTGMGIAFPQQLSWRVCLYSQCFVIACIRMAWRGNRAGFDTQITFQVLPTLMKMWRR